MMRQPPQAVRQQRPGDRGHVEPQGIQAAQSMRQGKIEEQDGIEREQGPDQREALTVLLADELVADQQQAEQACRQPGAEVAGTLEVEDEKR